MPETDPSRPTRRRILGTLSSASLAAIAGCSRETGSGDSERTADDGPWDDLDLSGNLTFEDDPNWRMLGHDTGNTFTNPQADGPSDDPSVQWTVEDTASAAFDGYRCHHPLIVDGTVYTSVEDESTADDVTAEQRSFVAVDAETGETETRFSVDGRIWRPLIDGDTLYAAVGGTIRAYDLESGTEQWRSETKLPILSASAIRLVGDVVLATDNAVVWSPDGELLPQLYAFDADTGELLWERAGSSSVGIEPMLPVTADGMTVLHHTTPLRDVGSGDRLAELPIEPRYPVLDDGVLYALVDGDDETVLASYDWSSMTERWTYEPDESVYQGWVVTVDDIVVANGGSHGLLGIDRDTGDRRWRTQPWDDHLGTIFRVATRDTVYVVYEGGAAVALDPTDGGIKWRLRTDEMNWGPISGCALADDLLVTVGDDGTLFGIS
ncbi:PQQ-binding-like beta-propeller repeat protein [Natrinema thermotolerans]|uniref:PQQ-binding-like beta-propeller repeat protein n=1 Tax=Natrinema thermotolerans TaxID=121872 RepID=A0AAF0PCG3_9EURY|nr:PQQ-binding-like beta-propeller repeat protein [Natrinema thermotolerans]QCC57915.1 pyrrolo-quinoline quinone [Natrinema thermotolerans]WMT09007.1 PQQ-binding-like beta-propeller repeat protein [Natrinema thermotolerans]